MNRLFTKILLWFLAIMLAVMLTFVVTTAILLSEDEDRQPPISQLMNLQFEEAHRAYRLGGRPALVDLLGRFEQILPGRVIATDGSGRDLVTGEDRSDLVRRSGPRRVRGVTGNRTMLVRRSGDGSFWYFFEAPRRRQFFWFLSFHHIWILGLIALLCYALARHLSTPVRRLQAAVDRFGRGDLEARAESGRRDELGQLTAAFNRMADRLQTLLAAQRRLLADVSHELRSPLARLNVALELARTGSNREAALQRIEKESERLNALVGELLEVTRVEGDPSALRRQPISLVELVEEVVNYSAIEAEARGCRVAITGALAATIEGDRELVRRAVENVVRNGIRYAPEGTTVEVSLEEGPCIIVRDYGHGVPPDALPRLFEPFYRVETDRGRATGGVGLGLSIARRAVEVHKGHVAAANADPGLRVTMCFPAR